MDGVAVYSTFDIRLRAVKAVEQGMPKGQVAIAYGIDRSTLYRWYFNYQQEGIDGLYRECVPSDSNHAERVICSAVVMRKTSYCNRSINGAETQMILTSIFKTLRQRGHAGTAVIVDALRTFYSTKELPKLPKTLQEGE